MAMYYQGGSEIQTDGLQTLYLMNPNYVGYSDHPTNMLYMNSASATSSNPLNSTPVTFTPHLNSHHQVVSIPQSHDHNRPSPVIGHHQQIQGLASNMIPRFGYNSWVGSVDDQERGNRNQPNMAQPTPQGLSLSLSTNQTGFNNKSSGSMQSVILGSKYLKAAQELLDEVVNVGKSIKDDQESKDKAKVIEDSDNHSKIEVSSGGGELTTAQRQEIQMKKAKLISMLDEVGQRYRQYNVQMQIIVASFEQAAGIGSAKSYTQLALKTISKQFRCLKDAISTQIKNLSKSLDEEGTVEGSKLKYIDNQLRQHRALQQLGMVQNNAWRPQRGLPERAVSVLRAWLFEHFLHPYPKDSDKQILAKQTGLTRSQVSNWFINARVRLWKPMVEEMYMKEMNNNQQNNTSDIDQDNRTQVPKAEPNNTTNPNELDTTPTQSMINPPGSNFSPLVTPLNFENASKKPRNETDQVEDDSPNSMLSVETEMKGGFTPASFNGFRELKRFDPGQLATAFHGNYNNNRNAVSLTLGLPPSGSSSGTTLHQQNFINFGTTTEADQLVEHDDRVNIGNYEQIMLGNFQNRKPFPAQLLPDFAA